MSTFWRKAISQSYRGLFLIALLGGAPTWAQNEIKIRCRPEQAQVWLVRAGREESLLGPVEQVLPLPGGAAADGHLTLRIALAGYRDERLTLSPPLPAQYPPEPLKLQEIPGRFHWGWLAALGLPLVAAALWRFRRTPAPQPRDGVKVGPYILGEALGHGATATVFRAYAPKGQEVALKLLDAQLSFSPEYRQRLKREVAIYKSVEHCHLVRLLDHGEHNQMLYLVYELLAGKSLRDSMASLPWQTSRDLIVEALEGAQALHAVGVAHRDLKPENLFLCAGHIKLVDLGIARAQGMTLATATGLVMGTPRYMAPEQVQGELDVASDQYALGTVLYEMLVGSTPFSLEDDLAQCYVRLERDAPALDCEALDLPAELGVIVARLLERRPEMRYPSAGAAAQALRQCGI